MADALDATTIPALNAQRNREATRPRRPWHVAWAALQRFQAAAGVAHGARRYSFELSRPQRHAL